jgi:protein-S-isoprenylcysteine O-methyltransferase Ste14
LGHEGQSLLFQLRAHSNRSRPPSCRERPYAYLRHPGYAGSILFTLGTPILLNSVPAFLLAVVTTLTTVLRTFLEDRTLRRELPGYQQYAQNVRYRLIPLVW